MKKISTAAAPQARNFDGDVVTDEMETAHKKVVTLALN